jgi:hypothetical protein
MNVLKLYEFVKLCMILCVVNTQADLPSVPNVQYVDFRPTGLRMITSHKPIINYSEAVPVKHVPLN